MRFLCVGGNHAKKQCHKKGTRIITYRDYSKFKNITFREMVGKELSSNSSRKEDFSVFNSTIKNILNRQIPLKKNTLGRMMGLL